MAVDRRDVVVVGGGHNALVAATVLARAGLSVAVFERGARFGGAAVSTRPFGGIDASISPYAYLVSLFPSTLLRQLGLDVELRTRRIASCTPDGDRALVIDNQDSRATSRSFGDMDLGADHEQWVQWQRLVRTMGEVTAPTLTQPLRPAGYFRRSLGHEAWQLLTGRPLGLSLEEAFESELVRGMVLTDALIGTFAHSSEPSLRQNRCWLYHVIGEGTGQWRVPVGGMGRLTEALVQAATRAGAELRAGSEVVAVEADGRRAELSTADGERHGAAVVLCGAAPAVLERLLGSSTPTAAAEGAQVKLNMLLRRLPGLRCGVAPDRAFTGTLHVNERAGQLDGAWEQAESGRFPVPVPCEVYCHSLTDPSVLGPELRHGGAHSLSLFALQTPARLFAGDGVDDDAALSACVASFESVLAEPLGDCLLTAEDGRPCLEVHTPRRLEDELSLPGGNIFHRELQWPWAETDEEVGTWGVGTQIPNVLLCGSGSRRGGAVSGIAGHNAAMAALALRHARR